MLGAVIGDIVGSVFEWNNNRSTQFPLFSNTSTFTDDSVLTFATAKVLLDGGSYLLAYQDFSRRYPGRGYGGRFSDWINQEHPKPYNSYGNGSAMRVSPVGFAFDTIEETLSAAQRSAEVTHNHPEGVKGAQATALAIFLSRKGSPKTEIKHEVAARFGYDLSRTVDEIRAVNVFDPTCQGSVPEALTTFFESEDFESAIRLAISIGGDSDTIACIAGGVAQAYYQTIPETIASEALKRLPPEFAQILQRFEAVFLS